MSGDLTLEEINAALRSVAVSKDGPMDCLALILADAGLRDHEAVLVVSAAIAASRSTATLADQARALDEMRGRAEAAEARVAVLEEALTPFADFASHLRSDQGDLEHVAYWRDATPLTVGDLRRAARAAAGDRT